MYGDFNANGTVNRMPKSKPESSPATSASSFGKNLGGTMVQALAIVVAFRVVDAVIEIAMAKFRKQGQQQPARNRREEHAVA